MSQYQDAHFLYVMEPAIYGNDDFILRFQWWTTLIGANDNAS